LVDKKEEKKGKCNKLFGERGCVLFSYFVGDFVAIKFIW